MQQTQMIRKARILALNIRLALMRRALSRTQPSDAVARLAAMVALVRKRNALMTASEVATKERNRGLV